MPRCTINSDPAAANVIALQNDLFRSEIRKAKKTVPGRVVLSHRLRMANNPFIRMAMEAVIDAAHADPVPDPHSERDCGKIGIMDETLVWKIDLMAADHRAYRTGDRTDLQRTWRVLTVRMDGER